MGKGFIRGTLLLLFTSIISVSALANPNKGFALDLENNTMKCGFSSGVESENYKDRWVPYEKTIWEVGGYLVSDNDTTSKMPDTLYNEKIGSIVGFQDDPQVLSKEYYKATKSGLNVYVDNNGALYFGVSIAKYFFDEEEISSDCIGRLCDVVLKDGTCIHTVICDIDPNYERNGAFVDYDRYLPYYEYELLGYDVYQGIIDASDGSLIRFVGGGNDGLKDEISVNPISIVRIYDEKVSEAPKREDKGSVYSMVDFSVDGADYGSIPEGDEIESSNNSGVYTEDEEEESEEELLLGRGELTAEDSSYKNHKYNKKKYVGGTIKCLYFDSTKKIVLDHINDFVTYDEMRSKISELGGGTSDEAMKKGMKAYLESLGGVFAKHAYKTVKVKTLGDLYEALDYIWGLSAIWGVCYDNPGYHMYYNWCHGNSSLAMWNKQRAHSPRGIGPGKIEPNLYGKNGKSGTASLVCNKGTYFIFAATKCKRAVKSGNDLEYKVSSNHEVATDNCARYRDKATEHYYGKSQIDLMKDLRTLDIILKHNHIFYVIENDPKNHVLTYAETGSLWVNPGTPKFTKKYKDSTKISSVWTEGRGKRIIDLEEIDIENSKATGEDVNSKDNEKVLNSNGKAVKDEGDLVGMDGVLDKISDDAEFVDLPTANDLSEDEKGIVDSIKSLMPLELAARIVRFFRVLIVALGLMLLTYVTLILLAFLFDRVNTVFDFSLTGLMTGGRIKGMVGDEVADGKNLKRLILECTTSFIVAYMLITGNVYKIIQRIINWITGIF